jgi:hypothetical protein
MRNQESREKDWAGARPIIRTFSQHHFGWLAGLVCLFWCSAFAQTNTISRPLTNATARAMTNQLSNTKVVAPPYMVQFSAITNRIKQLELRRGVIMDSQMAMNQRISLLRQAGTPVNYKDILAEEKKYNEALRELDKAIAALKVSELDLRQRYSIKTK